MPNDNKLKLLKDLVILTLQDNDTVVLHCPDNSEQKQIDDLVSHVKNIISEKYQNVNVIAVPNSVNFEIIRKQK